VVKYRSVNSIICWFAKPTIEPDFPLFIISTADSSYKLRFHEIKQNKLLFWEIFDLNLIVTYMVP
jgi:hypothetical protein